eukprot:m.52023 g.52023  ORF g.52023 m.52023 type:complete len:66 (+) comp7349_c0_seq1:1167-1364(+)
MVLSTRSWPSNPGYVCVHDVAREDACGKVHLGVEMSRDFGVWVWSGVEVHVHLCESPQSKQSPVL